MTTSARRSDVLESPSEEFETRVRGDYGLWLLIETYSARWAAIWYACRGDDAYCEAILQEAERFHDTPQHEGGKPNPAYKSKEEALAAIVNSLEKEAANYGLHDALGPDIMRAKADLRHMRHAVEDR